MAIIAKFIGLALLLGLVVFVIATVTTGPILLGALLVAVHAGVVIGLLKIVWDRSSARRTS
jgi:hypothetical protein